MTTETSQYGPDKVTSACQALENRGLEVITAAESSDYAVEKKQPWSEVCWLPAACYVKPQNADEVAATLATLTEKGITFAIRSTGHNPIPKVSSVNKSGVLIDLQDIKSLSLQDDGTVQIGGGARWGSVYAFLEAQGRSIIGARNLDVGVGGYTLGGGMPAFPNIHGLATDGVKNFQVVLGDSSIVDANSKTNCELWKALKGGGTNFGIVTRFDIETYPIIKTKYAVNVYDPADYVNILEATVQLQKSMEKDPKIGLFVSFSSQSVSIPEAFDPFLKLNSRIMEAVPWTDGTIMSLVNSIQYTEPSARRTQSAATIKVDLDLYIKAHELYIEANKTSVSDIFYTIQPLSTSAVQQGEAKGGNIMGIPRVAQNWWVAASSWHNDTVDAQAFAEVDDLRLKVEEVAESRGLKLEYHFMNDASPIQTVLDTYGPANLQLMKDVSARYDEKQVFQTLQNGGYLLRNIEK
ncbi:6-hydroxy-D-nicotine oxidase [Xylaria sp. FL0043]|nr:6-hydroxy-D-nicotine oxidase [Xylaria sp. FL0043]